MMDFIKQINPPGLDKTNLKKLYSFIGDALQIQKNDIRSILKNLIPGLSEGEFLKQHAKALNIPVFDFDTEETLLARVRNAAEFVENQGMKFYVTEFLDAHIEDRYELKEYPWGSFRIGFSRIGQHFLGRGPRIVIKVQQLTDEERDIIHSFLNIALSPDIEILIVEQN